MRSKMPLFHLPVELVELIFDQIVVSRKFARVMRIRRVNGQFKYFVDGSIFRLRFLTRFANYLHYFPPMLTKPPARESLPYLHSYLMYQALRGQPTTTSRLGRILLDRGVNPNVGHPPPVVLAIFKEHLNMFQILRDYGARLDTPETGGLAMALADVHGLSSMQDVLVHEGVSRDVIPDFDLSREAKSWYLLLS
ncbi:hypothetical protein F5B21DRAFT_458422 [Xylaria acuta]|nr:hypothetical protein F5B21DRAFT_458422 [Xylaria acuta]